ncbi:MAG: hypothetical protein M3Y64_06940 [Gemmatimonadota bacterium]|nr:hypothetical protein [Gemmatimonadota bacterium]
MIPRGLLILSAAVVALAGCKDSATAPKPVTSIFPLLLVDGAAPPRAVMNFPFGGTLWLDSAKLKPEVPATAAIAGQAGTRYADIRDIHERTTTGVVVNFRHDSSSVLLLRRGDTMFITRIHVVASANTVDTGLVASGRLTVLVHEWDPFVMNRIPSQFIYTVPN